MTCCFQALLPMDKDFKTAQQLWTRPLAKDTS